MNELGDDRVRAGSASVTGDLNFLLHNEQLCGSRDADHDVHVVPRDQLDVDLDESAEGQRRGENGFQKEKLVQTKKSGKTGDQ